MNMERIARLPIFEDLRVAAERVGSEWGCRLVALFGSAARRDPGARDVDIAVLGDRPVDTVGMTNQLIRELHVQHIDVCDLRQADPLLMALIARDGIPLYESTPGEFARFASLAVRRYADTRKFRAMERREIHDRLAQLPAT